MSHPILNTLLQHLSQHRYVFWHDTDQQAETDTLESLPDNVVLIQIDDMPALAIKAQVKASREQTHFLFYSQQPQPAFESDWLLNLRLQAKTFYADAISMQMESLGVVNQGLREHLKQRAKFLRAKDRLNKLSRLTNANDDALQLDLKMMTVLAGADQADIAQLLFKIIATTAYQLENDSDATQNPLLDSFEDYGLASSFWSLIDVHFGYSSTQPTIMDLLVKLLVTDFSLNVSNPKNLPPAIKAQHLTNGQKATSALVFVSQWRNHLALVDAYQRISNHVGQVINLEHLLDSMIADELLNSHTFALVEKRLIAALRTELLAETLDWQRINQSIEARRSGYWLNLPNFGQLEAEQLAYKACYDALIAATSFRQLSQKYHAGFSFPDAHHALDSYTSELFLFDQLYRQYHRAAQQVKAATWSVLQPLSDRIEQDYIEWFLPHFSRAWSSVLEGEQGLLSTWQVNGWQAQQQFYAQKVKPYFNQGVKRVFVVISDALRYEAAEELVSQLNSRNRNKTRLDVMLGVLPSYTSLGMAALLPHQKLSYKRGQNGSLAVQADGLATASIEQRNTILSAHGGVAVKADALINMGKAAGRDFVRDAQLVYVYHDRIDMLGDKQASEGETFEAVADTQDELTQLCSFLINNLNAGTVLITADHGFIYQESMMDERNRVDVEAPSGCIINKKRYMIGDNFALNDKVWRGNTSVTASTESGEGSVDYWLPKGLGRFRFTGGARFVHGGAMPQEIVVPLIEVKVSESQKDRIRTVAFSQIGMSNRVVSNRQRFEFVQSEPVSDKVQAVQVSIALQDGEQLISDEQMICFDSTSDRMDDRRYSIYLTIKSGQYDSHRDYEMVIRDAQTKYEISRTPIRIAIAFSNDF